MGGADLAWGLSGAESAVGALVGVATFLGLMWPIWRHYRDRRPAPTVGVSGGHGAAPTGGAMGGPADHAAWVSSDKEDLPSPLPRLQAVLTKDGTLVVRVAPGTDARYWVRVTGLSAGIDGGHRVWLEPSQSKDRRVFKGNVDIHEFPLRHGVRAPKGLEGRTVDIHVYWEYGVTGPGAVYAGSELAGRYETFHFWMP